MWKEDSSCHFSICSTGGLGCRPDEEKREFLEKLSDFIHDVPQEDLLNVAGDMNCHTGSTCDRMFRFWSEKPRRGKHAGTVSRA